MIKLAKPLILMLTGGFVYYMIEIIYRGYSHISMFILGAICFYSIGLINELFTWDMSIILQGIIGSIIVTTLEFITGFIVNIILKLNVWDYSNLPFNILGQVCLYFSFIWIVISIVAIILDDYIRYFIFKEGKPHYRL